MPIVVGVDIGTTKIASLALDSASREVLAVGTAANEANVTSDADRGRGRSEWDADRIVSQSFGLPMEFTSHREEAAIGAALIAAAGQ